MAPGKVYGLKRFALKKFRNRFIFENASIKQKIPRKFQND